MVAVTPAPGSRRICWTGTVRLNRLMQARLILFDIDGTLTQSQAIDSAIYLRTLEDVFGFRDIGADWSQYKNATDSGILDEVFERRVGRAPTASEVSGFRSHFVDAIVAAEKRAPFREVNGAARFLSYIRALPCHHVGLATGGWSDSARCKMRSAGMSYDAFPAASADDGKARFVIMQAAIDRAITRVGSIHRDGIVYIGDGIWDARACRQLGVPFIGIADGPRVEELRAGGARAVFRDYADVPALLEALSRANHGRHRRAL
jgi:phosphoglycolate phosphatase-like HAD superfamily hydrolase